MVYFKRLKARIREAKQSIREDRASTNLRYEQIRYDNMLEGLRRAEIIIRELEQEESTDTPFPAA